MINFNVSPQSYKGVRKEDLSGGKIGSIVNQVKTQDAIKEVTPQEFIDLVAQKKHHFTPCEMTGYSKTDKAWKSSNLIVLDIDNETPRPEQWLTLDQFQGICMTSGVKPLVMYTTDSHKKTEIDGKKKPKFRAVFYFEPAFTNKKQWKEVAQRLAAIFSRKTGVIDPTSWKPTQFYYGGENIVEVDDTFLFDEALNPFSLDPVNINHLYNTILPTNDAMNGNPVTGEKQGNKEKKEVEKRIEKVRNRLNNFPKEEETVEYQQVELPEVIQHVNIDEDLVPYCKMLQAFKAGYWIKDEEGGVKEGGRINHWYLWRLQSNLQYIKGGLKWFDEHFNYHIKAGLQEKRKRKDFYKKNQAKGWNAARLSEFSPYPSDHKYQNLLAMTGKGVYGLPQKDPNYIPPKYYSLETALAELKRARSHAFDSSTLPIYDQNPEHTLIRIHTGVGKTHAVRQQVIKEVDWVKKQEKEIREGTRRSKDLDLSRLFTIAFTSHQRIQEFKQALEEELSGEDVNDYVEVTPQVPDLGTVTNTQISQAYNSGKKGLAAEIMRERRDQLQKQINNRELTGERKEKAVNQVKAINDYKKKWDMFYSDNNINLRKIILTTHDKAMQKDEYNRSIFPHNHIVFDETPSAKILYQDITNTNDINVTKEVLDKLEYSGNYNNLVIQDLKTMLEDSEKEIKNSPNKVFNTIIPATFRDQANDEDIDKILKDSYTEIAKRMLQTSEAGRMTSNPLKIIDSEYYKNYKTTNKGDITKIIWITSGQFPQRTKITIMSATLEDYISKLLPVNDGKRLFRYFDVSNVEILGKTYQPAFSDPKNYFQSYSSSKIQKDLQKPFNERSTPIKELTTHLSDAEETPPVITFNSAYYDLNEEDPKDDESPKCWFGNVAGYDGYRGGDIIVLGDFSAPWDHYVSLACAIYGNLPDFHAPKLGKQMVTRYGYTFPVWTFEDERLQKLHLDHTEAELMQAVGRARAVREEEAHVFIYSSRPLPLPIN